MKDERRARPPYRPEDLYDEARERMEELEELERERLLDPWEEAEKEGARMDLERYGRILEEEEEATRRQICESQGLSRWC